MPAYTYVDYVYINNKKDVLEEPHIQSTLKEQKQIFV